MNTEKRILFRAIFDLSLIAPDPRLQTLLRFGFIVQLDIAARREQTGGRSRGRTHVVGGVGEKGQRSDARDRSLRKRRRHGAPQDGKRGASQDKFAPRVTV